MRAIRLLGFLLPALFLTACVGKPAEQTSLVPEAPSQWVFQSISGSAVVGRPAPTLVFAADGGVSGWAGCNRYNGRVMVQNGIVQFSPMMSTRMACADPALNVQEQHLLDALTNAERFTPNVDGSLDMYSRRAAAPSHLVRDTTVAAAPPQPPKAARTFLVFFEFDRADLLPEAKAVIAEAAKVFKATGSTGVTVVGHTDTVGARTYNQALSTRRAASVKAGLVDEGVPGSAVVIAGQGDDRPLVATGPDTAEPQNRRVTIDLAGAGS